MLLATFALTLSALFSPDDDVNNQTNGVGGTCVGRRVSGSIGARSVVTGANYDGVGGCWRVLELELVGALEFEVQ